MYQHSPIGSFSRMSAHVRCYTWTLRKSAIANWTPKWLLARLHFKNDGKKVKSQNMDNRTHTQLLSNQFSFFINENPQFNLHVCARVLLNWLLVKNFCCSQGSWNCNWNIKWMKLTDMNGNWIRHFNKTYRYGRSPECVRRWVFKVLGRAYVLPQSLHKFGFDSDWMQSLLSSSSKFKPNEFLVFLDIVWLLGSDDGLRGGE